MRVGPGAYEVVGAHRVTRESSPNVPARSEPAVFLAPALTIVLNLAEALDVDAADRVGEVARHR